jgi:hypothetical protein
MPKNKKSNAGDAKKDQVNQARNYPSSNDANIASNKAENNK